MYLDMDYSEWREGLQSDQQEERQLYIPPRSGLPLRQFARLRRQLRRLLVEFAQYVRRERRVVRGLQFQQCVRGLQRPLRRTLRAASVPLMDRYDKEKPFGNHRETIVKHRRSSYEVPMKFL